MKKSHLWNVPAGSGIADWHVYGLTWTPTSMSWDIDGTTVFIGAGRADPIVAPKQVERLAAMLRESGADVTIHWESGGHALTRTEVAAAHEWIIGCLTSQRVARGA